LSGFFFSGLALRTKIKSSSNGKAPSGQDEIIELTDEKLRLEDEDGNELSYRKKD
tara:strand:- start:56 stop:220 length:165 start_codon:yes stop_codon:yes gene_type:complete